MGLTLPEGFGEDDDDEDGVWPENEGALMAFLEVCTQFRTIAHGNGMLQRSARFMSLYEQPAQSAITAFSATDNLGSCLVRVKA